MWLVDREMRVSLREVDCGSWTASGSGVGIGGVRSLKRAAGCLVDDCRVVATVVSEE